MRVFVTGASGYIGQAVTRHLLNSGYSVTGLARNDAAAGLVSALGADVYRGGIYEPAKLADAAEQADAVIHCAYDHAAADKQAAADADEHAIMAMAAVLAGSDRPLLVTAATSGIAIGRVATEDDAVTPSFEAFTPRRSEQTALQAAAGGVRAMALRFPPTVHGPNDEAYVPALITFARQQGRAAYVGDGGNRWPAIHINDAVRLYAAALEQGTAGAVYNGTGETGIPFRRIAETIGARLGLPAVSISPDEAEAAFGWLAPLAQADVPASSARTQQRLGWRPEEVGLIADLETGSYFA